MGSWITMTKVSNSTVMAIVDFSCTRKSGSEEKQENSEDTSMETTPENRGTQSRTIKPHCAEISTWIFLAEPLGPSKQMTLAGEMRGEPLRARKQDRCHHRSRRVVTSEQLKAS